jgi:hypothetical protein
MVHLDQIRRLPAWVPPNEADAPQGQESPSLKVLS